MQRHDRHSIAIYGLRVPVAEQAFFYTHKLTAQVRDAHRDFQETFSGSRIAQLTPLVRLDLGNRDRPFSEAA